ncbi:MAG: hypothetical protein ACJ8CR_20380 [Roseiflexaceae bacterium]
MQPHVQKAYRQAKRAGRRTWRPRSALPALLWMLWTIAVVAVGYISWHADVVAQRPINTLGLVIHCVVTGIIGLVVLTKIEMHLEPWRFLE